LAEVSVEAGAAAEAGGFGSKFKSALNCRKELILCQEEMEQGRAVRDRVAAEVWDEGKARVEAEWVDRLPQDRVEIVSVQTAEQRLLMLPDSLVMQKAVLNVEQRWQEVNIFLKGELLCQVEMEQVLVVWDQ